MKKLKLSLTFAIVVSILLNIYLAFAVFVNANSVKGYSSLAWGQLYVYFLFPLIIIQFIILTVYYLKVFGLYGLGNLKWQFILVCIFVIMLQGTGLLGKFLVFKAKFPISITNNSNISFDYIKIYGRHDLIEIMDLKPFEKTIVDFRGMRIDHTTKNYLENRIQMDFLSNKKWRTEVIVGTWRVITEDTLKVTFHERDSISIN